MVNYELRKALSDNISLIKKTIAEHPELEPLLKPIQQENERVLTVVERTFSHQVRRSFS